MTGNGAHEARVLVVCTGNICRSPFIERLLQHELDQRQSTTGMQVLVRSAGTAALIGASMDQQASAQLVARGGDPSGFSARALTPALISEADLVLTATRAHRGQVALMYPKAMRRVFTFRDFADLVDGAEGLGAQVIGATQATPRERVRQVTDKVASSRGLRPPLAPGSADIVDPYRRKDEVFATMAQQVADSMPAVVRSLVG